MGKTLNVGTLLGIAVMIMGQAYAYGQLNQRIESIEENIIVLKTDYVKKDVAEQKLLVRDVHINKLEKEVLLLREDIKENKDILQEILRLQLNNGG